MLKKVLIIEDDIYIAYSLQAKLSAEGYITVLDEAHRDESAILANAIKTAPDFIVMDLILPKADGFKLLTMFKQDKLLAAAPIFIFTDLSDEESKAHGLDLGASHFLIKKEINFDEFVDRVKKTLENIKKI